MKKGFTLIELMVVIAIIGILASIVIPNVIAYRAKGNNNNNTVIIQQQDEQPTDNFSRESKY